MKKITDILLQLLMILLSKKIPVKLSRFTPLAQLTEILTPVSALSLLIFCLLYTPCVAAVASIKRELGGRWAAGVVVSQCVIAWLAAFVVHGFALLFGM